MQAGVGRALIRDGTEVAAKAIGATETMAINTIAEITRCLSTIYSSVIQSHQNGDDVADKIKSPDEIRLH